MKSTEKFTVDKSVRPQDDFFHYVNNAWLKANPIPDSESRWGAFHVLRDQAWLHMKEIYEELQEASDIADGSIEQKARDLYVSGMNYSKLEKTHLTTIKSYFEKIYGITSKKELSALIGDLQRLGMNAPWTAIVDADDKNSAVHILRIHQAGLTLPDRDFYIADTKEMREIRHKYREHLVKVAQALPGLAKDPVAFSDTILQVETSFAVESSTRVELRDAEANYHKITYNELKDRYKHIDWDSYAERLHWKCDDKITDDQPKFMLFVDKQIAELPLEIWQQYLAWQFVAPLYGRISDAYAQLKFDFFGRVLSGTKEMLPLWKRVVATVDDTFGEAVGQLYVERHFPESSKLQVLEMVESIRAAYAERIKSLDWMCDSTKTYALQKLHAIKLLIGYPDTWRDFSGLSFSGQSYIDNILTAEAFENDYELQKLHKPTSRDEWFMYPQTVNAYHDPNRLVICFPAAILQPPFFDPHASDEVNYGGIGSVIGHEFTHGFDDQGCEFDAEGNLRQWQTPEDKDAFHSRASLIIDQADAFEVVPGTFLKGKLIIGEAIADLGGVEIALHALQILKGELSEEMRKEFFLANASIECGHTREEKAREYALSDPHPPEIFRINATLQHVDAFHETYAVKENDILYRASDKRARIW